MVNPQPIYTREYKYVECDCDSSEHTIRFIKDVDYIPARDEIETSIYLEVQLCRTKNVFQRIYAAIKYIFGYQCKFGHWDCVSINEKSKNEIIKFLQER